MRGRTAKKLRRLARLMTDRVMEMGDYPDSQRPVLYRKQYKFIKRRWKEGGVYERNLMNAFYSLQKSEAR